MNKIRILLGLTALVTTLAIGTANASAKFFSNNGRTSGSAQLKAGSIFRLSISSDGSIELSLTCPTLENGVWKIRKSEKAQGEVTEGGHENFTGQFKGCTATIAGETKAATVNSTCELQIVQTGATTFRGGVVRNCSIAAGTCVVTIAASAANEGLEGITAVNVETKNLEISSNITTLVAESNEKCKNLGVTGTTGGFLVTIISHEQKVA